MKICTFIGVKHEPPTIYLVEKFLKDGHEVYIPFINQIKVSRIKSTDDLKTRKDGYIEPKFKTNQPEFLDMIIVPGLAFDKHGNRLGQGSGWYDRFLAKYPKSYKIGLCYKEQLVDYDLPVEEHDIKMDEVVAV